MNIIDRIRPLMTWLLDEYNNNPGRVLDMYDLMDLPNNRGIYGLFARNLISLLNRNISKPTPRAWIDSMIGYIRQIMSREDLLCITSEACITRDYNTLVNDIRKNYEIHTRIKLPDTLSYTINELTGLFIYEPDYESSEFAIRHKMLMMAVLGRLILPATISSKDILLVLTDAKYLFTGDSGRCLGMCGHISSAIYRNPLFFIGRGLYNDDPYFRPHHIPEFNPGTFGLGYKGPNEYWWLEYDRKRRIEAFNTLISIYEQKVHSKK